MVENFKEDLEDVIREIDEEEKEAHPFLPGMRVNVFDESGVMYLIGNKAQTKEIGQRGRLKSGGPHTIIALGKDFPAGNGDQNNRD